MTYTLAQLIKSDFHKPIRRVYIKRRLVNGAYEGSWLRVDFYRGINRVFDFGSASILIDAQPGQISRFEASEIQLIFDNSEGHWNIETWQHSLFYPDSTYLNRKYTLLKIDTGYLDEDGNEVGVEETFRGVINSVTISPDQVANVTVLSLQTILQRFPISDLAMTGAKTVSQIVTLIMNQSKITDFIPYVAPNPETNPTIQDTALLEGTYWEVIQDLAYQSNSVPMLIASAWSFASRDPSASSVWTFTGLGDPQADILSIGFYDDEGADRVRVFWKAQDSAIDAISSNAVLLRKYLSDPQIMDLSKYSDGDKQVILDSLLAYWETNKPVIEFTTRFMVNQIKPKDRVTIRIYGNIEPLNFIRYDDGNTWDDGQEWADLIGPINILGTEWMVISVIKNIETWSMIVRCEKIV